MSNRVWSVLAHQSGTWADRHPAETAPVSPRKFLCLRRFFPEHTPNTIRPCISIPYFVVIMAGIPSIIRNRFASTQRSPCRHKRYMVAWGGPPASMYRYREISICSSITIINQRLWFSGKIQASHTLLGWSGLTPGVCLGPGFDSRWAHRFLTCLFIFLRIGVVLCCPTGFPATVSSRERSDETR